MNYEFKKDDNNITWVTLEPLVYQTKLYLEKACDLDITKLNEDEQRGVNFSILALQSVCNFLKTLQTEAEIRELTKEKQDVIH